MGNLVIVAIPDEDDHVWKVSSEKVPHLTLLFLGEEAQNVSSIVQFVQHAAEMTLKRFYLTVDHRGELGADQADVVFFKTNRFDAEAIQHFRSALLKDNNIRTAYDSATQFDGPWHPHLTLGYPATPAKPDERDYGIHEVIFSKIAVWTGDYDGPEFRLKDYWDDMELGPEAVAQMSVSEGSTEDSMTQTTDLGLEFLTHYGTKGMKWGVRNDKGGNNTSGVGETKREGIQRYLDPTGHELATDIAKTVVGTLVPVVAPLTWPAQIRIIRGATRGANAKAIDREEKKFAEKAMSPQNFAAIHNGSIAKVNRHIAEHNQKYPDLSKPATKKKYDDAVLKSMQDAYRQSANSLTNKNRTMHLDVEFHNDGQDFKIHAKQGAPTPLPSRVKHADADDEDVTVEITGKIQRSATGHIVGFEFDQLESKSMAQTADLGAEFLEHFGVKGMRWGVRTRGVRDLSGGRTAPASVAPVATSKVPSGTRRKTKIKTAGGENHPAHDDAIKVALAQTKLKKSGPAALSNRELQEVANRMNLERNVSQLVKGSSRAGQGQKFVRDLTGLNKQVNETVNTGYQTTQLYNRVKPRR